MDFTKDRERIWIGPKRVWPLFAASMVIGMIAMRIKIQPYYFILHISSNFFYLAWIYFLLLWLGYCSQEWKQERKYEWVQKIETVMMYVGLVGLLIVSYISAKEQELIFSAINVWPVIMASAPLVACESFMAMIYEGFERKKKRNIFGIIICSLVIAASLIGTFYYIKGLYH